jgi:hypothetical protein
MCTHDSRLSSGGVVPRWAVHIVTHPLHHHPSRCQNPRHHEDKHLLDELHRINVLLRRAIDDDDQTVARPS